MSQDPELVRRFRRRRYRQQQLLLRLLVPTVAIAAAGLYFGRLTEALLAVLVGLLVLVILQLSCIRDMLGYLCSHQPEEAAWRYRLLEEVSELREGGPD
ncbi:MAG: hypothetical protein D6721_07570 [Gammaproteobacteria bacterium]|nr:MAG: hypothetical protein D6721_07570 [Gammaproteobacteria bacterium]